MSWCVHERIVSVQFYLFFKKLVIPLYNQYFDECKKPCKHISGHFKASSDPWQLNSQHWDKRALQTPRVSSRCYVVKHSFISVLPNSEDL